MKLAKIIGELRVELRCLDTAIASLEELKRVQAALDSGAGQEAPPDPEPDAGGPPPVKRKRGRPRKNTAPTVDQAAWQAASPPEQSGGGSTASAA